MAEDFLRDVRSGLFLPEHLIKAQRAEAETAAKIARGKFFSTLGRTERYNAAGSQSKPPDEASYRYIRDAYDQSLLDQLLVQRRQYQVARVCQRVRDPRSEIGWMVRHIDSEREDFQETPEIERRCREMEGIIETGPRPEVHPRGFRDFVVAAVEEQLVTDRKTAIIIPDRAGKPRQYYAIDGTTVSPIAAVLYRWLEARQGQQFAWGPDPWDIAVQALSYQFGFDLTRAAYVQEVDGVITGAWTSEQMSVDIVAPSVEINRLAYGRGSVVQRSLKATDLFLSCWDYNQGLMDIRYPESMLVLFGDYDPQGLQAFTRQITSQIGTKDWSRLAVVMADEDFKAQVQKLRDSPKDMLWDRAIQLLLAMKSAFFAMHPSEINAANYESEAPAMNQPTQEKEIAYAKEEGFKGLLGEIAGWVNRFFVRPRYPDLRLVWNTDLEVERQRVEVSIMRTQGYGSINEARVAENKPKIAKEWADYPLPIAQVYAQAEIAQAQQQQMAEAQERQLGMQGDQAALAQRADHRHEERMADRQEQSMAGQVAQKPRIAAAGKGGAQQKPRSPKAPTVEPAVAKRESAKKSGRRVLWTWQRDVKLPDGRIPVRVGGRAYTLQTGPYGATWRAPNGAVVLHSDEVPSSPEEAAEVLREALEGARDDAAS